MRGRRRPLIWSPEARDDLTEIWTYYSGVAGPQTADNVARKIGGACRVIEDFPLGGGTREELSPGVRSLAVSPYVVFYRVTESSPEIVRILDGRRDLDEIFAEDPVDR